MRKKLLLTLSELFLTQKITQTHALKVGFSFPYQILNCYTHYVAISTHYVTFFLLLFLHAVHNRNWFQSGALITLL